MKFLFFKGKRKNIESRFNEIHESLSNSFSKIKDDVFSLNSNLQNLHKHKENHSEILENIESRLLYIENLMEEALSNKTFVQTNRLSKQTQTNVRLKQTSVPVQTVLLDNLKRLTPMERALVWALLNTDLKLSYADLSRILGKDESTVRGQVNNIKMKTDNLILEKSENNGQKRFYIVEKVKDKIMKKYKSKSKKKTAN